MKEVYILGKYKAEVVRIEDDGHITCKVYEGLPSTDTVPQVMTYMPFFVSEKPLYNIHCTESEL